VYVSVEMITAVFTGLTGLLAAIAAVLANRSRRVADDGRFYRRQARDLHRKLLAALGHINLLEEYLTNARRPLPARPEILETDDDDDGPPHSVGANASP
jgi:hypothetical protein